MGYLSVKKFWDYQNADVWKKCNGHPPWYKQFVHRDREMEKLPPVARLLWFELLGAATRHSNVLEDDLNWLYAETRVDPEAIAEMLPLLLKGGWLSQTESPRRSRMPSRKTREETLPLAEADADGEEDSSAEQSGSGKRGAALPDDSLKEKLAIIGARLEHGAAPLGSEGRLFEVLNDMDEGSPKVIRSYLEKLPVHVIEQVREEVLANSPRKKTAYAVEILKARCASRGVLPTEEVA